MKISHILFLATFTLFLFFIVLTYKDYGVSWDELAYVNTGNFYFLNFFNPSAIVKNIELQHAVTHGALFDVLFQIPQKLFHPTNTDFPLLHLTKALSASTTLIFLYMTILILTGNPLVGFVGIFLMIFTPRWTGDIFDNHIDVISTLLFSAELFLAVKLLTFRSGKNLMRHWIAFSLVSAISFSSRLSLIIVPIVFLPLFIFRNRAKGKSIKLLAIFFLMFLITLVIVDPALRSFGWDGIVKKLIYTVHFQFPRESLFEGEFFSPHTLPWYYLPKWIFITTPLTAIGLFLLGFLLILRNKKTIHIFVLLTFLIPLVSVMILRPVLYDGWRQFMFLSIPLVISASVGFEFILRGKNSLLKIGVSLLLIVSFISTAKSLWQLHPYEYVYFNSFVGGLKGAYGKYETDYWSKSYQEAVGWLIKNEMKNSKKSYAIYSCDYRFSASYYFSPQMKLVDHLSDADYAVCFTRWNEDKKIPGKIIYTVQRQGVPLSFVKKLR